MTILPLFDLPEPEAALPERMRIMHLRFGRCEGHKCGECRYLEEYCMGGDWFKCALTVQTNSAATDWRKGWPACGQFEAPVDPQVIDEAIRAVDDAKKVIAFEANLYLRGMSGSAVDRKQAERYTRLKAAREELKRMRAGGKKGKIKAEVKHGEV